MTRPETADSTAHGRTASRGSPLPVGDIECRSPRRLRSECLPPGRAASPTRKLVAIAVLRSFRHGLPSQLETTRARVELPHCRDDPIARPIRYRVKNPRVPGRHFAGLPDARCQCMLCEHDPPPSSVATLAQRPIVITGPGARARGSRSRRCRSERRVMAKDSALRAEGRSLRLQRAAAVVFPGVSLAEHRTPRGARDLPSLVRLLPNWEYLMVQKKGAYGTPTIGPGKEPATRISVSFPACWPSARRSRRACRDAPSRYSDMYPGDGR